MDTAVSANGDELRARLGLAREKLQAECDRLSLLVHECSLNANARHNGGTPLRLFARESVFLGETEILLPRQSVRHGDTAVRLTPTEWQLLTFLLLNPETVHSRLDLAGGAWGSGFAERAGEVEVYVSRLRRKLGPAGHQLQTVRGHGYRLKLHRGQSPAAAPSGVTAASA
jgi:DNA-binding response OmpR family regulator